ncbi:MAG TPA: hypothetical protein VGQ71_14240 [Terriglobales bacterium]|nr:hypothetical protein [Terriglobales bacterium]
MERNLSPTWRTLYVIVGVALLAYAIYAHDVIPGLTLLVLILLGALSIASGLYGH